MIELSTYSSSERYLVHGDFHLGNILADDRGITALIDWEMAMYGDFVFDLATFHLWTPSLQLPQYFLHYCKKKGVDIPNFEQRLRAALLCKSLDGLRFFAKKKDENAYLYMKKVLQKRLDGTIES